VKIDLRYYAVRKNTTTINIQESELQGTTPLHRW
jgi:hypothetical protein